MFLKKINYKLFVVLALFIFNVINYFKSSLICVALFTFLSFVVYYFSKKTDRSLIIDSFLYTNIVSLVLPARIPFFGNQFAYYDHLYKEDIAFNSIAYSSSPDYFGFDLLSRFLLLGDNLTNLNVALFFVNFLAFYSIFRFYKNVFNDKNITLFKSLLLIFLVAINLPSEFNSFIGFPKLFLNGTAGLGSFGLRVFTPASFSFIMFLPLTLLLENKTKQFFISGLILSLFHYYIFLIMFVVFISYISSKRDKLYLFQSFLLVITLFFILDQYQFFQDLSEHLVRLKNKNVNFNLIPVISIGTILNSGFDGNFVYYINLENFTFFKPEFSISNFSPTVGVFNNESSIPFEKLILFFISLYLTRNNKNLFNMLLFAVSVFLTSHYLFSVNLFSFHAIFQPYRIIHIFSIVCFMVIISSIKARNFITFSNSFYLVLILLLPVSFFLWKTYSSLENSYNIEIFESIQNIEEQVVLIPLNETKDVYYFGFPNIFVSTFPPTDYLNNDIMNSYFDKLSHYENIYSMKSCKEIENYIEDNKLEIQYIFVPKENDFFVKDCNLNIIFFSDSI